MADEQENTALPSLDIDMDISSTAMPIADPNGPAFCSDAQSNPVYQTTAPRPILVHERNGTPFVMLPGSSMRANEQENTAFPSPDFDMDISSMAMPIAGLNGPALHSDAGFTIPNSLPQKDLAYKATIQPSEGYISRENCSFPPHSDIDIVLSSPALRSDQGEMPPLVLPLVSSKNRAEFLFSWNRQVDRAEPPQKPTRLSNIPTLLDLSPKRHKKLASQQNETLISV
ncbi:hypothetical protein Hypma_001575 [Hypsizygus marmoreus]|uniref:Uncharacterized protein n=1 Tax=Hypsizygus marmoreus TaxID=39966 RepID=A0A369K403_HYPMA|nr:hypothetical protein Hypma_001575 [Hypsizygus marmoreus]